MTKPRIYWCWYPKLKRGYWRVRPCWRNMRSRVGRSDWTLRQHAYRMVQQMNRALEDEGKCRP